MILCAFSFIHQSLTTSPPHCAALAHDSFFLAAPGDLTIAGFARHLEHLATDLSLSPQLGGVCETDINFAHVRRFFLTRVLLAGGTAPTLCKIDEQTVYQQHPIDRAHGDRDAGGKAATEVMRKAPKRSDGRVDDKDEVIADTASIASTLAEAAVADARPRRTGAIDVLEDSVL